MLQLTACTVDLEGGRVLRDGEEVRLTTREAALFGFLVQRAGEAVDRDALLTEVWGYASGAVTRTIDATVARLRAKIERDPANPEHLLTVWGEGYRLELPRAVHGGTNIRPELDASFGRSAEAAAVLDAFARGARLVTLVGPAGIGKTRLARRCGRMLADEVSGGAWLAELSEAVDAGSVARAVGEALGGHGSRSLASVLVERGRLVLVLDNLEQVVSVAGEVICAWLQEAPELAVLVTSRERLRVAGEVAIELGPLGVEEAAALFVDRAWGGHSRERLEVVGALVERLDRVPLAVELAAGLADLLGPAALLQRLHRPLDMLVSARRDRPGRQRSLRAAIASSWDVLDDAERRTLVACSVFRGGFTLEAAEAVVGEGAVERLFGLRAKSLLRVLPDTPGRLGLYEAIRGFAAERGPDPEALARHAAYFAGSAATRFDPTSAPPSPELLEWAWVERDNLRLALEGSLRGNPAGAASIAFVLFQVHASRGPIDAAVAALDAALGSDVPATLRGHLLRLRASALHLAGRESEAAEAAQASLALAVETGDALLEGRTLAVVASIALGTGRDGLPAFERALALHEAVEDVDYLPTTVGNYATALARAHRDEEAAVLYSRSAELHLARDNPRGAAIALGNRGLLDVEAGRLDAGRRTLLRALDLHRAGGDQRQRAVTMVHLGICEIWSGRPDEAMRWLELATGILERSGERHHLPTVLRAQGLVRGLTGQSDALMAYRRADAVGRGRGGTPSYLEITGAVFAAAEGELAWAAEVVARAEEAADDHDSPRVRVVLAVAAAQLRLATGEHVDLAPVRALVAELPDGAWDLEGLVALLA